MRTCDNCGSEDIIVAMDKNELPPWKSSNPYYYRCAECGTRKYCSKAYFEDLDIDEKKVVPVGESEPKEAFYCPAEDCGEIVGGEPDECPECGADYQWE